MSLEDDLKARAVALVSQQMANWVVAIQKQIAGHQEQLVRSLDELQESVARYDERINEGEIDLAIAEVLANQPPQISGESTGPSAERLRASFVEIEKGASLSEVLTFLVNEVAQYVDRAAMFIIKGTSAIGWYGRGFDQPEIVKQLNIPLNSDTVFRIVHNSRHALRGHITHSPGTAQVLARLAGNPQGILAIPLVLREKLAAVLFCDTQQEEVPVPDASGIEMLVLFASKVIDLLSLAPKAAGPAVARTTGALPGERAAAIREEIRERVSTPAPPPRAPIAAPTPVPAAADEGSSTVMFRPQAAPGFKPHAAAPPVAARAPAAAPVAAPSADEQKAHEDAKRFARLVVSEIKLYNEAKVAEGRRSKDIYERLRDDIERGRQMYHDRVPAHIRDTTNYFFDELVRILAGGDASALGQQMS